jgi:TetR/AcrR family transcriptional regulator, lmrAB and yxaGH operons repressor
MATGARERMIDGAVRLLATKGLQATSFSEVLDLTGAPRGSIYHHFPNGKSQLVGEAVRRAAEQVRDSLEVVRGQSAVAVAEHFLALWRLLLVRTGYAAGCSIAAVTVAADSPTLLDEAAEAFRNWSAQLADLLREGGAPHDRAAALALTLIAGSEGAVMISRAERSIEPFDAVANSLLEMVRRSTGHTD